MGRFRSWGARDPKRVIVWFVGQGLGSLALAVFAAVTGRVWLLILMAIVLADELVEGSIFVPRALRAMRQAQPPN